jgi:hypothetical protein
VTCPPHILAASNFVKIGLYYPQKFKANIQIYTSHS